MYAVVTLQIKTIFLFVFFFPFQRVPPVVDPVPVVIPPMPSAKQFSFLVGTRDGRPAPRGGGSPSCPAKMIKTAGNLWGKIKA